MMYFWRLIDSTSETLQFVMSPLSLEDTKVTSMLERDIPRTKMGA